MTLEPAPTTMLGRLRRVLRALLAPVQPWDWDELPVRHWWDVYAK